jgi:hypothetical protein
MLYWMVVDKIDFIEKYYFYQPKKNSNITQVKLRFSSTI